MCGGQRPPPQHRTEFIQQKGEQPQLLPLFLLAPDLVGMVRSRVVYRRAGGNRVPVLVEQNAVCHRHHERIRRVAR